MPSLLNVAHLNQIFGYLYSVQGCTLTNLVAREPEGEATVVGQIFAHTAYVHVIFASCFQRHGVNQIGRIVFQCAARSSGNGFLSLFNADGVLGFNPYAFRV